MLSKDAKRAASLRKALAERGQTVAWLARRTGYSRSYVSSVLGNKLPFTPEFQTRAIEALRATATVPVQFKGRVIQIPESIYQAAADLPLIVVESAYEEAWKRSWLQENAATTLAIAADRAWNQHTALTSDAA